MSDLSKRFDEAAIGLASRGQLNRHLEPRLWEELRLRLQAVYRKATGESMAVLSVDHNPASRISQQDAELERLRRDVEEASAKIKSLVRQRDELKEEADELVVRQYEVSAQAADISRLRGALEQLVSHAERHKLDKGLISGKLYEAARDALNGVQDPLAEARKAALIEAAEIAEETAQGSDHLLKAASHAKDIQGALVHGEGVMTARIIATALRRKAEETGHE